MKDRRVIWWLRLGQHEFRLADSTQAELANAIGFAAFVVLTIIGFG